MFLFSLFCLFYFGGLRGEHLAEKKYLFQLLKFGAPEKIKRFKKIRIYFIFLFSQKPQNLIYKINKINISIFSTK